MGTFLLRRVKEVLQNTVWKGTGSRMPLPGSSSELESYLFLSLVFFLLHTAALPASPRRHRHWHKLRTPHSELLP